jgi:hypothetical protein
MSVVMHDNSVIQLHFLQKVASFPVGSLLRVARSDEISA